MGRATEHDAKPSCAILHPYSLQRSPYLFDHRDVRAWLPAQYLVLVSGGSPPFGDAISTSVRNDPFYRIIEHGPAYENLENFVSWYCYWAAHGFSKSAFVSSAALLNQGVPEKLISLRELLMLLTLFHQGLACLTQKMTTVKAQADNCGRLPSDFLESIAGSLRRCLSSHHDLVRRLLQLSGQASPYTASAADDLQQLCDFIILPGASPEDVHRSPHTGMPVVVSTLEIWIQELNMYIKTETDKYK